MQSLESPPCKPSSHLLNKESWSKSKEAGEKRRVLPPPLIQRVLKNA
jgi:hypothetical protein